MRETLAAVLRRLDRRVAVFLVLLTVLCAFFSVIIPPFQSPDEFDHVKRAYLLGKGEFVLDRPPGQSSGGMIDSGLAAYMSRYQRYVSKPDSKLSADVINSASTIQWSGTPEYSAAPGTGFYFPIVYAPQAVALVLGRQLGLSVDLSYRFARGLALAAVILLLAAAFRTYPPNPLVWALLVLPMSIFQLASASLDGVSTGIAIFAIALFLRLMNEPEPKWGLIYCFAACVVVLSTSRMHLLPFFLLLLFVAMRAKERRGYVLCAVSLLFTMAWLLVAIKTTVDLRPERATITVPTSTIIAYYLRHPPSFFEVLWVTVSDGRNFFAYCLSFLGILGWLDTTFSLGQYVFLAACVTVIGLLCVSRSDPGGDWMPRAALAAVALASILLIFFALLVTWSVHPAPVIRGVQGRYFLVPAIMVAYAISGAADPFRGAMRKLAIGLVGVLMAFAILDMTWLLLGRYYLAPHAPVLAALPAPSVARPGPESRTAATLHDHDAAAR